MYLIFDTETTGLPRSWNAPLTDLDNWPRMVQLAWHLYDKDGGKILEKDLIIKPDGFVIPYGASSIHGITTSRAMAEGIPLDAALSLFEESLDQAEIAVGHNLSFDEKIVGAEFLRRKKENKLANKARICTMQGTVEYCELPGPHGYKWPRLMELHQKLFNEGFADAHNAAADVAVTAKCFWELKKLGVLA